MKKRLNESVSYQSTVRAITNYINESLMQVYQQLGNQAQAFFDRNGNLSGFGRFVAGGTKKRWYDAHYFNGMSNELHDLVKFAPGETRGLKMFLSEMPDNLGTIEQELPGILRHVARALNDTQLAAAADNWMRAIARYNERLDAITSRSKRSNGSNSTVDDRVYTTNRYDPDAVALKSGQAQQAEALVNQIIGMLPKRIQGDVRMAIARSPNKLQALEAELMRRGVKLPTNESLHENMSYDSVLQYKLQILLHS